MTLQMPSSQREALLLKIGAVGSQAQILKAIVRYSRLSLARMTVLADKVDKDGPGLITHNYLPARLLGHIKVNPVYGCWECHTYAFKDYPRVWDELNRLTGILAYRYVFERMVRPLLPGEQIEHICRNRRCVWWELHLTAVSGPENNRRRIVARAHRRQPALFAGSDYEQELRQIGMYPPPW